MQTCNKYANIDYVNLFVSSIVRNETLPTIVFLHDSLGCSTLWRDFPLELSELTNCNALVYDRQGYGKSQPFTNPERSKNYLELEADVLIKVLTDCRINNVILFGHSDGGSIALIAASKYPLQILGLITEGAHIFVEEITLEGIREAVKLYNTTNLKDRLQKYHGDKTNDVFKAWTDTWLSDDYSIWNIEKFLPKISCPVLIIQGEKDEYGSEAQVKGIVNQVAGKAHSFIIPGIGHTPHKEAKDIILQRSSSFIQYIINSVKEK